MSLKVKPNINLWDKSFKAANTQTYILTMQIGLHGFSFSLFNPEKNKQIGLESYSFYDVKDVKEIPEILDQITNRHKWLKNKFKKVNLLYQNSKSTLVPVPLFDEKNKKLYLEFNHGIIENHRVGYDKIRNLDTINIYYLPEPVVSKIFELWPNAVFNHFSTFFIDCLALNFKNKLEKETIFINVNKSDFDIAVFSNNKLLLYNNFKFNYKEDFIYFLLATFEQLGYNPETTDLIITGDMEKGDKLYTILEQYVGSYKFMEPNENIRFSYIFDEIKHHKYYVLLNAVQCE